ncbi:MAG: PilZ domain-containing protein [Rhodocyclaceae bacterium]|jgi:hypothetical protein|nr:PilZ domain-containing protein [Rhodocyclaceae bacterium]MCL4758853.1 PilZ domain-containing protein [Rhodocyclaceae bacterium]
MTDYESPADRRLDRRIPLGSRARILLDGGDVIDAECVELSVSGMTLRADFVPGQSEIIEVEVVPPATGLERPPLVVRLEVRRCHMVAQRVYEIGGAIVKILD